MTPNRLIITVLALVLIYTPALGQEDSLDYIQAFAGGHINWGTGKVAATGFCEPAKKQTAGPAVRNEILSAARKIAAQHLSGMIGGLRLTGGGTVADTADKDPLIAKKVGEMVLAAPVIKQNFLSDGAAEIIIEMSLNGGFAQLILPEEIRHIEAIQPVRVKKDPPAPNKKQVAAPHPAGGLVIDARGLGLVPAMVFTVLDENGKPVYGSAFVSREYAVQWGMAAYLSRLPTGNDFARVNPDPLVIKGLRAVGPGKTDIVISTADAARLKGAVENLILLRKGRVAVVVD